MANNWNDIVPYIDVSIQIENDESIILTEIKKIINIIRPHWSKELIYLEILSGGLTNLLIKGKFLKHNENDDTIIIKLFGANTDLIIDRKKEISNMICLSNAGIASSIFCTFNNGYAYKYIDGITMSPKIITQPKIYKLIAAQIAKIHNIQLDSNNNHLEKKPIIWDTIEKFLNLVPVTFDEPEKQEKFNNFYPTKTVYLKEIRYLKSFLASPDYKIVFCHNDLQPGNIIYNEKLNSIGFIDFEYSDYNYQAFDIGNHFIKFAGIFKTDVGSYPSKELQIDWLKEYLSVLNYPAPVNNVELHQLYEQVNNFAQVSPFLWSIWSFIQAANSTIDFDYMEHGASQFVEYMKRKTELSLTSRITETEK